MGRPAGFARTWAAAGPPSGVPVSTRTPPQAVGIAATSVARPSSPRWKLTEHLPTPSQIVSQFLAQDQDLVQPPHPVSPALAGLGIVAFLPAANGLFVMICDD